MHVMQLGQRKQLLLQQQQQQQRRAAAMGAWPARPLPAGDCRCRHGAVAAAARPAKKVASGGGGGGGDAALAPGALVLHRKDGGRVALALVGEADGKTKWWAEEAADGRRFSLSPKAVALVLPPPAAAASGKGGSGGAEGGAALLGALKQAAADALADAAELLEVAHAVAAEQEARAWPLDELAELLFDAADARAAYCAFELLSSPQGQLYFKAATASGGGSGGGGCAFVPRSDEDVAAAVQAAAEQAAAAEEAAACAAAFRAAAAAAQRPPDVAAARERWLAGPHGERVRALLWLALAGNLGGVGVPPPKQQDAAGVEALARETLRLLGKPAQAPDGRPNADGAAELLTAAGLLRRHEPLPLLRLGRSERFPPAVDAAAAALLAAPPPDRDAAARRDLRHLRVFAVDDADTVDVDDGLSIEELDPGSSGGGGGWLLWVHVADVTRFVPEIGGALDAAARARARSLYLPFGTWGCFPPPLAEGLLSLGRAGGGDRCALSLCVEVRPDGALGALRELTPSTVRVAHSLTYCEADADMALGPGACQHEDLQLLYAAAAALRGARARAGSVDIDTPELEVTVPEEDLDSAAPRVELACVEGYLSPARTVVAEAMIAAGAAVGAWGAARGLPLPYRSQPRPRELPGGDAAYEALPASGPVRGFALRQLMTRSNVGPAPARHASLALDAYVQVTSPIRRYADVVAHHNVKAALRGEAPPFSGEEIARVFAAPAADAQRALGGAERDVQRRFVAEWFRQRAAAAGSSGGGEEAEWPALVLGWAREGLLAVLLEGVGVETVVRTDLPLAPGERLLLRLRDANVAEGRWRLSIEARLGDDADDDGGGGGGATVEAEQEAEEGAEEEAEQEAEEAEEAEEQAVSSAM